MTVRVPIGMFQVTSVRVSRRQQQNSKTRDRDLARHFAIAGIGAIDEI